LGQEANLGSSLFGKGDNIPAFKEGFFNPFSVYKSPIATVVNQSELIPFPNDFRVVAGNNGQIGWEAQMAGRIAADRNDGVRKLLNLTLQRPQDVNKLDNNHGWSLHGFRFHYTSIFYGVKRIDIFHFSTYFF
jgi:hypothetical protein